MRRQNVLIKEIRRKPCTTSRLQDYQMTMAMNDTENGVSCAPQAGNGSGPNPSSDQHFLNEPVFDHMILFL